MCVIFSAAVIMQLLYTVCVPVLCVFVSITQGSMNIGLLIRKSEEEYFKLKEGHIYTSPSPPPHEQAARMARYIVHNSGMLCKINVC